MSPNTSIVPTHQSLITLYTLHPSAPPQRTLLAKSPVSPFLPAVSSAGHHLYQEERRVRKGASFLLPYCNLLYNIHEIRAAASEVRCINGFPYSHPSKRAVFRSVFIDYSAGLVKLSVLGPAGIDSNGQMIGAFLGRVGIKMHGSYRCPFPILGCPEGNSSILDSDDDEDGLLPCPRWQENDDGRLTSLPQHSEGCLSQLVLREVHHLPREDYARRLQNGALDASLRRDAIDWIEKVHVHYCFGPLSTFLSINYLDRFLSTYSLPQGKAWMMQLLSVACLSLAAKMEETEVPLSLDLQVGEPRFIFEAKTIQRMELLVLSTLKWRMQAVTPFSYIDYFLLKFSASKQLSEPSLSRSVEIMLKTAKGVGFLEYRPSEVAAAVALYQSKEAESFDITEALHSCNQVNKVRVLKCYELIQDMVPIQERLVKSLSRSSSSAAQSPIGVLDAACLSYKTDDTMTSAGSQVNSECISPDCKRRKVGQTEHVNA